MFHKALWMRNYKQGKYLIWAFWIVTLFLLPLRYWDSANSVIQQMKWVKQHPSDGPFYYSHYFNAGDVTIFQIFVLIGLACVLIGWERSNQSIDLLFSMPFKRKDIFLSKWMLGVVHIVGALSVSFLLMYIIKKTTIHNQYQDFTYYVQYFFYAYITLISIYTFTLFVGTLAGSVFSQGALSFIFLFLPIGLFMLGSFFVYVNFSIDEKTYYTWGNTIGKCFESLSIALPLTELGFGYSLHPDNDPKFWIHMPHWYDAVISVIYTAVSLVLGIKLYERTPNEHNGKILLYEKLYKAFLVSVVVCFSLFGGMFLTQILSNEHSLVLYYIGVVIFGVLSYFITKCLMNLRMAWGSK